METHVGRNARTRRAKAANGRAGFYVSRVRNAPVVDGDGARIGRLRDVVAAIEPNGYPPVRGIVVRSARRDQFVPLDDVAQLDAGGARIRRNATPTPFTRREGEFLGYGDLLDRQVVDAQGARVLRVNDVMFAPIKRRVSLVGIDVSVRGLLRRLAPGWMVPTIDGELLDWSVVEPLAAEMPDVRLRLPHRNLTRLDPADLGRIIDHLPYRHAAELVSALDDETAADALEEVGKDRQPDLLDQLSPDKAVSILDHMAPDAAADLLNDLPPKQADDLIDRMEPEAASDVRLLLTFAAKSAGGLMTTDFVIALEDETTRDAVEHLRTQLSKPDLVYYVYVVDNANTRSLRGVVSLRDLLLAKPDARLADVMNRDVHSVDAEAPGREVARVMREYNLLALPVVDAQGRMLGLVTADDVLDMMLPQSVRRHLPRLFS